MRSLLAVILIAAVPAAHAQEADTAAAGEVVRLAFGWPAGTSAAVEATRTKVGFDASGRDSSTGRARYRLALEPADSGYVIRYDDLTLPGLDAAPLEVQLNQRLAGLMPSYRVSAAGEFQRIDDPARLRRAIDSLVAPTLAELRGEGSDAGELLAALTSDEMLTSLAAQEWNALVGNWIGAELEIGSAYTSETVEHVPLLGGVDLPMIYEFGVRGRVPCDDQDAELACVELVMASEPEAEAATEFVRRLVAEADPTLADSLADARLTIENEIVLVTHAATLLPYHLTIVKNVEFVSPRETGGQRDVRELRFRHGVSPTARGAPAGWTDASRLQLGMDSLRIVRVSGEARQELGMVWDELVRVDVDGVPALRRTYRTTNSLYGDFHQVSHSRYPTLEALSDRRESRMLSGEIAYRADSIIGWSQLQDSARVEIALAAPGAVYDALVVDLMVRAADLAPGFYQSFQAFLSSGQRFAPMAAWVTGSDTIPGAGGVPAEVWVVELDFDGLGSTMWIDKRTRALHRQAIRMGAGVEMVMER